MLKSQIDANQKIVIVTHEMVYGVPHALKEYLVNQKIEKVTFIGLPLLEQKYATLKVYTKGRLIKEEKVLQNVPGLLTYIVDCVLVCYWLLKQKERNDLYIGVDALSAFIGFFLKRIGVTKRVIFYALDFAPVRFTNELMNKIFHTIEKFDIKNVDEVWNVSPTIAEGRENFMQLSSKKYLQKVVPSGVWIKKIKKYPFHKVKRNQMLFLGHLLEKQGLQMVFLAMSEVLKKIPDFKLVIMGGGEYEEALKKLVKELHIEAHIDFKGWVKDRKIIDTMLGESAAAIVTYIPEKEKRFNFSYYGDPIKLKEYLASGLPVILTDVPHNAREIEKRKCGIVVRYDKHDIEKAIIALLSNETKLKEYKENARAFAKEFDWNIIFAKAFM